MDSQVTGGDVATNLALHGLFSRVAKITTDYYYFFLTTNETVFHLVFSSEAASS